MLMIQKKLGILLNGSAKEQYIEKLYGEKAYDKKRNLNILDDLNVEPVIVL
jgi:hypothetical protein